MIHYIVLSQITSFHAQSRWLHTLLRIAPFRRFFSPPFQVHKWIKPCEKEVYFLICILGTSQLIYEISNSSFLFLYQLVIKKITPCDNFASDSFSAHTYCHTVQHGSGWHGAWKDCIGNYNLPWVSYLLTWLPGYVENANPWPLFTCAISHGCVHNRNLEGWGNVSLSIRTSLALNVVHVKASFFSVVTLYSMHLLSSAYSLQDLWSLVSIDRHIIANINLKLSAVLWIIKSIASVSGILCLLSVSIKQLQINTWSCEEWKAQPLSLVLAPYICPLSLLIINDGCSASIMCDIAGGSLQCVGLHH